MSLGQQRFASVAIRFGDGSGCILAALANYIGNIVVDDGVISVAYVPSTRELLHSYHEKSISHLDQLHATVAAAARFGVFRIEGGRRNQKAAKEMGDRIRVMKAVDATLGIYAAYAYASVDTSRT